MNASASEESINRNRISVFSIIAIVLGMLAMMSPGLTGLSVAFLLGYIVLACGIVRAIWAYQAESFGKGFIGSVISGLTIICGILMIANPLFVTGMLTIILALYFVLDGIIEIIAGISLHSAESWGGMLFGGIVSVLLGILIWAQYPLAGAWAMSILLGIKLFMIGLIMVTGMTTTAHEMEKEKVMEE